MNRHSKQVGFGRFKRRFFPCFFLNCTKTDVLKVASVLMAQHSFFFFEIVPQGKRNAKSLCHAIASP